MVVGNFSGLVRRSRSERGAALAEYALLVLLIAIVAVMAVATAGDEVSEQYSIIASSVDL
jgi:Flp pilus assembly pilin Flp